MYDEDEEEPSLQSCKCVGFRYCALCEKSDRVTRLLAADSGYLQSADAVLDKVRQGAPQSSCSFLTLPPQPDTCVICPTCRLWFQSLPAQEVGGSLASTVVRCCADHSPATHQGPVSPLFDSLEMELDGISPSEEAALTAFLDRDEGNGWKASQSGRKKQEWGPQANFKKRRVKLREGMTGMPAPLRTLFEVIHRITAALNPLPSADSAAAATAPPPLATSEQQPPTTTTRTAVHPVCHGPMTIVEASALEYLEGCSNLDPHMDDPWLWGPRIGGVTLGHGCVMTFVSPTRQQVEVFLPPRAVFVLHREVRYEWLHGIRSSHVFGRRLSITMRELNPDVNDVEQGLLDEAKRMANTYV